jgi:iron complex outermembrane receptor protein
MRTSGSASPAFAASVRRAAATLVVLCTLPWSTAIAQDRGTLTGRVTDRSSGFALQGATVAVTGTALDAVTRGDGSYRLSLPPGRYEVRARLLGYEATRDTVQIASGATITRDFVLTKSVMNLEQVVVTGTRRQDRTIIEAPVPIDVLTASDIRMSGRTETAQILQMLAPSLNFPRPSVADGTDHVRPATLRGLGPDQVLVLVNGKRRHTSALVNVNNSVGRGSAGVDLNAIPASAIDRIEVLRDGAAAQYGSDAIAGVINIILKQNAPSEISTTFGQTNEGDGRSAQAAASHTIALGAEGYVTVSGEFRFRDSTNRSLPDTRVQYFPNDPRNSNPPRVNHWLGDPKTTDYGAFLNAGKPLSATAEVYGFGGITVRNGRAAGFWRRALDDRTIRAFYPDGFLPNIVSDILDYSGAIGIKGDTRGWNYDVSANYGHNAFTFTVENSANVSLGLSSPRTFDAGTLGFGQLSLNLDVQRQAQLGLPQPVSIALGAEVRRDAYRIERGEEASYIDGGVRVLDGPNAGARAAAGSQVFPGFRPSDEVDESRSNVAGYIDLETNVTRRWTVGLAGRIENYSDFGSSTNGKFATRFEVVPGFALRGAVATGFRAPSLAQSWFSSTATNFLGSPPQPVENRTFPVGTPVARLLGAQPLEAEKSLNVSYGVVLRPVRTLSLSADFYRIDIDDRIVFSGNLINATTTALLTANGFPGVGGARYFTNAIDTKTNGVDVVASYGVAINERSTLRLAAAFNKNTNEIKRVRPTPPQLSTLGEALFDRTERVRFEKGQPLDNIRFTVDYSLGKLGVVLQQQRFGEVSIAPAPADTRLDQTFDAKWLTDVNVSYQLFDKTTLSVGADNVFDTYPDRNIAGNSNSGIFPYSSFSPFGFNGRFIFVRAAFRR